jgi:S1-C subfamily serine protease
MQLIINSRVGEVITLTVKRKNKIIKKKVRVGREPLEKAFLNMHVENLNPSIRRKLRLVAQDAGVVIKKISENSPMKKAGFKPGDVIFMIDNVIVKNVFEYKILSLFLAEKAWIFVKVKRKDKIFWNTVILKSSESR